MSTKLNLNIVRRLGLHSRSITHIGSVEIGKEVNDTAGEQDSQVKFPEEFALFCWIPILNGTDVLCLVHAGSYRRSALHHALWFQEPTMLSILRLRYNSIPHTPPTNVHTLSLDCLSGLKEIEHHGFLTACLASIDR